jgi:hypothetical protein
MPVLEKSYFINGTLDIFDVLSIAIRAIFAFFINDSKLVID